MSSQQWNSQSRTLRVQRRLAGLVLRDLVHLVLAAGLALAERPLVLRNVHLQQCAHGSIKSSIADLVMSTPAGCECCCPPRSEDSGPY